MKFYGHANLQKNQLQNAALSTLTTFPADPVVGMLSFVNSIVFICVQAGALPVWVPMTREITAYTQIESTPSAEWTIVHNLNTTSVNVQLFNNLNQMLFADEIQTDGPNSVTAFFNTAVAGRAVVVTGHFDGNPKPTYAYTHFQSSASDTWVIVHNLGYYPIVRVFIGSQEVQPASVTHDSTDQTTITFSTAQSGYARLI